MKTEKYKVKWCYRHLPIHTYCDIVGDNDVLISSGVATCSRRDHFCRETGRKLSLARALKNAQISKEERKLFWEKYRNMKKGGRW